MGDFLQQMASQSESRAQAARAEREFEDVWDAAMDAPSPLALTLGSFDLIAEVKSASPSEGPLLTPLQCGEGGASATDGAMARLVAQARAYESAGAAAISVLTEPTRFGGSLEHLRAIASAVKVPVMRKDFLVADYQIVEAREAGASGVLLIVRMLDDEDLFEMTDLCRDLGMFALLEAFDEADLQRLSRLLIMRGGDFTSGDHVGALLLGLNCRNLADLSIEPGRFAALRGMFPSAYPIVAESGIASASDAAGVARLGYNLALVGSSLMKSPDPAALARAMIDAGRAERLGRDAPTPGAE